MEDYKALYYKLFGAVEDAIATLIEVQQQCEALYIEQNEDAEH